MVMVDALPAEMFGGSDFWLETRVIIKISKKMILHMKPKVFFIRKKQNKIFFLKKKSKMADSKKGNFSKSPILNIFLWKFHGLVLGLVELNDAKGIDVA